MFSRFLAWLFGLSSKPVKSDVEYEVPRPDPEPVVKPVISEAPSKPESLEIVPRSYMTPAMIALLALIRAKEAPAGYNQRFAEGKPKFNLSTMTFDQVRALGRRRVTVDKKASSAIGAYQFITKTLDSLKSSLSLKGTELFTPEFQDDLAVALMVRRGYMKFMREQISVTDFSNNLAKEWASLPVVSSIRGASRNLRPGQSYYAGDGLNTAHHKPAAVMAAVRVLKGVPV